MSEQPPSTNLPEPSSRGPETPFEDYVQQMHWGSDGYFDQPSTNESLDDLWQEPKLKPGVALTESSIRAAAVRGEESTSSFGLPRVPVTPAEGHPQRKTELEGQGAPDHAPRRSRRNAFSRLVLSALVGIAGLGTFLGNTQVQSSKVESSIRGKVTQVDPDQGNPPPDRQIHASGRSPDHTESQPQLPATRLTFTGEYATNRDKHRVFAWQKGTYGFEDLNNENLPYFDPDQYRLFQDAMAQLYADPTGLRADVVGVPIDQVHDGELINLSFLVQHELPEGLAVVTFSYDPHNQDVYLGQPKGIAVEVGSLGIVYRIQSGRGVVSVPVRAGRLNAVVLLDIAATQARGDMSLGSWETLLGNGRPDIELPTGARVIATELVHVQVSPSRQK